MSVSLGLDISSTSTGIAVRGIPVLGATTGTIASKSKNSLRRLDEFRRTLDSQLESLVSRPSTAPDIAVIEAYSMGGLRGLAAIRLAEFGGMGRALVFSYGIPILEIEPTRLKRWATGTGGKKAGKVEMVAAAKLEGGTPANDDEADAFFLAQIGTAVLAGEPDAGPLYDVRFEILDTLRKALRT